MSSSELKPLVPENDTYKELNPLVSKLGDFTPFYIAIAICTVILGCIIILNVVCCCSRYSDYWLDRHTGNRWLVSIWSATPHKQPPLDYTELSDGWVAARTRSPAEGRFGPTSVSLQPLTASRERLDLHKRESDI